jgi:hypothetical protein
VTKNEVSNAMTKAETDTQKIRQLEESLKRVRDDLDEYMKVQKVLVLVCGISQEVLEHAHDLVRNAKAS